MATAGGSPGPAAPRPGPRVPRFRSAGSPALAAVPRRRLAAPRPYAAGLPEGLDELIIDVVGHEFTLHHQSSLRSPTPASQKCAMVADKCEEKAIRGRDRQWFGRRRMAPQNAS